MEDFLKKYLSKIVAVIVIVIITLIINCLIDKIIDKAIKTRKKKNLTTFLIFIKRIKKMALYVIAFLTSINQFDIFASNLQSGN